MLGARRRSTKRLGGVLHFGIAIAIALWGSDAHAVRLDRDVKTVMTGAVYGLVIGTVLGLVTLPLTDSVKTMFLGSSVGMYIGAAVGGYHAMSRDDPQNPLRPQAGQPPQLRIYAAIPVLRF